MGTEDAPLRLFFYGTLGEGMDNPVIRSIRPKLTAARPATTRGTLHALPDRDGWYPGLLPDPAGRPVEGMLYDAGPAFTAHDLATLDAYEAFDPADLAACEYVRREIEVTVGGSETLTAQAYVYHRPLPPGARRIAEASFAAFLAAHGLRALAPRDP
ncbi:MAG: gamma-glutamylcyclotransferase family protein [Novosphingobium sp.]